MNARNIIVVLLFLLLVPVSLLLGEWAATDPMMAILVVLGIVSVITIGALGTRLWILIPFFMGFTAPVRVVPGGLALRELVTGGVCAIMLLQFAARRVKFRFHFGIPEIVLSLIAILVIQAYLRNPVGVAAIGSATVGGRPYFEMAVAFAAFMMVSVQVVPAKVAISAGRLSLLGALIAAGMQTVAYLLPRLGDRLSIVFAFVGTGMTPGIGATESMYGRRFYLKDLVPPIVTGILAKVSPLELFRPNRFGYLMLAFLALITALFSGFRSLILWAAFMTVAALLIRRQTTGLIIMSTFSALIVAVVLVAQGNLLELPLPAQRALSFLPAQWNPDVKANADASVNWRVEMWKQVLTTDRYIENKLVGDGFGVSRHELMLQLSLINRGHMTDQEHQDFYMISGGYHSGPVESVRRTGYVGAVSLIFCQIAMAVYGWKSIRRAQGTRFEFATMVFGLPLIVHPFDFCLVFGTFKDSVILLCLHGAFLRVLGNALAQEAVEAAKVATSVVAGGLQRLGRGPAIA